MIATLIAQTPAPEEATEELFKVVEQMPRFPGCEGQFKDNSAIENCSKQKMLEYIYKNLKYPEAAIKDDIEGMCVVQFVVNTDGSIAEANLIRDIGGGCGEASVDVVNSMNNMTERWTPGMQRGEPVRVMYTLPVRFRLESGPSEKMSPPPPPPPPPSKKMSKKKKKGDRNIIEIEDDGRPMTGGVTPPPPPPPPPAPPKKMRDKVKQAKPPMPPPSKSDRKEQIIEIEDVPVFEDMAVEEDVEEEIFKVVENMPRFPGCEDMAKGKHKCAKEKLMHYIYGQIRYPEEARKNNITGKVVIQFVVDKKGKIKDGKVLRDIGGGCGEEALRVVNEMNYLPKSWSPGTQRGRAVNVLFTLPVSFGIIKE